MKPAAKEENPFRELMRYWNVMMRYRWWIAVSTVVLTAIGISLVSLMTNYYQATTTILVDPQQIPERYVATTVVANPAQRLNTISQEVLSPSRLQTIIDKYDLYPTLRTKMFREDIVLLMRNNIKIEVREGGGASLSAFTITYISPNQKVVAPVTNELAAGFIEWNLKSREQQVAGTTDFLKSELERARKDLQDQEGRLGQFKLQHSGELPDQQISNMQMLSQLRAQYQGNRDTLNRLESQRTLLLHTPEITPGGAPATPVSERAALTAEKRDLERKLADLERRYTPAFPDIARLNNRLEQVKARLSTLPPDPPDSVAAASGENVQLALVDREMKRVSEEQRQLVAQMKSYQGRIEAAPIREQQMRDLSRNYQVTSDNYRSLLEKTSASELAGELEKRQKGERFTILDPATEPERPFKPNRRTFMMMAFMLSFAFAVASAVAKELLNETVKSDEDLEKAAPFSAPLLTTIPVIETPVVSRRKRVVAWASMAVITLTVVVEIIFLLKVKPIL